MDRWRRVRSSATEQWTTPSFVAGHTDNSIGIDAPPEFVFDVTNDFDRWTEMFDEYAKVEVLERDGACVRFRLTTKPDEEGEVHTWASRRCMDRTSLTIDAQRLEPLVPWAEMNIHWDYEPAGESGTRMRWIQDFRIADGLPYTDEQGEEFINGNSSGEMESIKRYVEKAWAESRSSSSR